MLVAFIQRNDPCKENMHDISKILIIQGAEGVSVYFTRGLFYHDTVW